MRINKSKPEIKAAQNYLHQVSREKHAGIPITEMMDELKRTANLTLIQEDDTEWSGIFCGREGSAVMVLADATTLEEVENSRLAPQWYKINDTKYEANCYLS